MRAGTKLYIEKQLASELWRKTAKESHARIVQKFGKGVNK